MADRGQRASAFIGRRFDATIVALVTALMVVGLAAISWRTVDTAHTILLPALSANADTAARSIASLVSDAVGYGIPLEKLVDADGVLRAALDENRDFAFATIVAADGTIIAEATRGSYRGLAGAYDSVSLVSAPIIAAGTPHGEVMVATPLQVADDLIRDLWIDAAVVLLVAVLVAVELTAFAFTLPSARILRGLTQRLNALRRGDLRPYPPVEGRGEIAAEVVAVDQEVARVRKEHERLTQEGAGVADRASAQTLDGLATRHRLREIREAPSPSLAVIRAPVFLFFLAEEMNRPFLPTYIARFAEPAAGLSTELVIALPIVIFMAIVALSQPTLNGWTERIGRARSLRAGALIGVIGFLGTGFSSSMMDLIGFRALTAVGVALVFVSAQGFIVDRTEPRQRARGIGLFVSAIMAAMLCGPPIGGILADRLGDHTAFTVSAVMALAAFLCAFAALPRDERLSDRHTRGVQLLDLWQVLTRPIMFALLVGCALPAKMLLIGVCFYYLPLTLSTQFEPAIIGRVLMLYGLAMLVVVPAVSRVSDQAHARTPFVVGGAIASALALVHLVVWPEPWGAALMVLQIGIAQGLSTTPQSALVGEIGRRIVPELSEGGIYGVFRLVERLGTAIGPLFVGAIWTIASPEAALVALAIVIVLGASLFAFMSFIARRTGEPAL
ncbi:MAG: MFS transporter, partial [Pseudomonadota bacterium]